MTDVACFAATTAGHALAVTTAIRSETLPDEAFFFVQCPSIAKLVGNVRQHPADDKRCAD